MLVVASVYMGTRVDGSWAQCQRVSVRVVIRGGQSDAVCGWHAGSGTSGSETAVSCPGCLSILAGSVHYGRTTLSTVSTNHNTLF